MIAVIINSSLIILDDIAFFQNELMKPCVKHTNTKFAKGCKEGIHTLKYKCAFKGQGSYNLCHDHPSLLILCYTYSAVVHLL